MSRKWKLMTWAIVFWIITAVLVIMGYFIPTIISLGVGYAFACWAILVNSKRKQ